MARKIAFIIDPLKDLKPAKDSSLAMAEAMQRRGWQTFAIELNQLSVCHGRVIGHAAAFELKLEQLPWLVHHPGQDMPLDQFDAVIMRKDPPFNMRYIYATYLLEQAGHQGARVFNHPAAIRNANEKLFILNFPDCTTPMMVSSETRLLRQFIAQHKDVILKPLDGMGGTSIFRIRAGDPNVSVIIETLTEQNTLPIMAQQFIAEIKQGDKRILMIDGEAVDFALARIPAPGETRGNLAAGGHGEVRPLTEHDRWIAAQVSPQLKSRGLLFVGLDVIGDYLTEINVTSPTCIREISAGAGIDVADKFVTALEQKLCQ